MFPKLAATPPHNGFSLISNDKLLEIYSTMLKCRMLQARASAHLLMEDKSIELRSAESAIAGAGIVLDLLPGDTLAPSSRRPHSLLRERPAPPHIFSALVSQGRRPRPRYAPLNLVPPSLSLAAQLDRAIAAAAKTRKAGTRKSP